MLPFFLFHLYILNINHPINIFALRKSDIVEINSTVNNCGVAIKISHLKFNEADLILVTKLVQLPNIKCYQELLKCQVDIFMGIIKICGCV